MYEGSESGFVFRRIGLFDRPIFIEHQLCTGHRYICPGCSGQVVLDT